MTVVTKTKRNTEIHKKKEAGTTYRQLSVDYNLSIKRLQDIVNRERNKLLKDK
jgi:Mor family transcriptional regulator